MPEPMRPAPDSVIQTTLDGFDLPVVPKILRHRSPRLADPNPCVRVYGPGPAGATCATCAGLVHGGARDEWLKCTLRGVTHGERTDHRAGWPACGRYRAKEAANDGAE